jgi:hypothetical protein
MLRIALPIRVPSLVVLVIWMCFVSFHALAAGPNSANLTVTIVDKSHAYVPDASSVVLNTATGVKQDSRSNKNGTVSFPFLMPGKYRLLVHKDGFANVAVDDIVLNVGDDKTLELTLQIGTTSETVSVNADQSNINTTDASVSTVVDRKFVENIPLNGRSFQDLISMTPGVVTQSPQSTSSVIGHSGDFSVNGQRTESNYYMVDGVSGNVSAGPGGGYGGPSNGGTVPGSTALGTTQSLLSIDAMQEFRVQTSTYSSEYGRSPGAQVSFLSRSGTDTVHGSVFDFLRNDFFDANDWFNDYYGRRISPLRQNDFGGTLGGPVFVPRVYDGRKRAFFFVSYEGLRLTQPQAATLLYVPSLSLRQAASPVLQPILNSLPQPTGAELQIPCSPTTVACSTGTPNGSLVPSGLAPFIQPYSLPSRIDSTSVRIDHSLSPRLALFFRAGYTPSTTLARNLSAVTTAASSTLTYTAGATSQLTQNVSNEFRLGYSNARSTKTQLLDSFGGSSPINLATAMGIGSYTNAEPYFDLYVAGAGNIAFLTQLTSNELSQWNVLDTVSVVLHHQQQVKFGVDYRHLNAPLNPPSPYVYAEFDGAAPIVKNAASSLTVTKNIGSTPITTEVALFAQDEWRVAPRLSLSLGLRWEFAPPPAEANGNMAYTLVGNLAQPSTLSLAPKGTPLWKTAYFNLVPRLGAAWQAHSRPGWETVVRGGGGVFFDSANQVATLGYGGLGFYALKSYPGSPLPVTPTQLDFSPSTNPPYTSTSVFAFPGHLQLPYSLEWNLSLQQALGQNQSFTVSYLGASGRRLLEEQLFTLGALNSQFGSVYYFPGGITSNYDALQVQFQRTVSHGIQAIAAYTWSHSIDFGSNSNTLPVTRGNSDFDVRNNLQAGLSWELPGSKHSSPSRLFTNGWSVDGRLIARSGFPITLQGNRVTNPQTGTIYYTNVNVVPGQPIYLYGTQHPGGWELNKAAFSKPTGTSQGDAPRNFVRGFGADQVNIAARREFHLAETLRMQFRAEAFNALNHPNFGYVDPTLTDATFGQATKMLNQSLPTLASQYQQGGSRSMQFALKLLF